MIISFSLNTFGSYLSRISVLWSILLFDWLKLGDIWKMLLLKIVICDLHVITFFILSVWWQHSITLKIWVSKDWLWLSLMKKLWFALCRLFVWTWDERNCIFQVVLEVLDGHIPRKLAFISLVGSFPVWQFASFIQHLTNLR